MYPCSPFIDVNDLIESYALVNKVGNYYVYPVSRYSHPIQRSFRLRDDALIEFNYPNNQTQRTQDFKPSFHDAGQFYWGSIDTWLTERNIHTNAYGFEIPSWRCVDIDNEDDWIRAEMLSKILNSS